MKNNLKIVCFILIILPLFAIPVLGSDISTSSNIMDDADMLTAEQEELLNQKSIAIAQDYNVSVGIITVESLYLDYDSFQHACNDLLESGRWQLHNPEQLLLMVFDEEYLDFEVFKLGDFYTTDSTFDALYDASYAHLESNPFLFFNLFMDETRKDIDYITNVEQKAIENYNNIEIDNVMDTAGLLSEEEIAALNSKADALSAEYAIEFYILTVADYKLISNQSEMYYATTDFYADNDLGYGEGKDGMLLMLSMAERDYRLIIYGDEAHRLFNDSTRIDIEESFLEYFADDNWYGGFDDYLSSVEHKINYGWLDIAGHIAFDILLCGVFGFIIAFGMANVHKTKLKSVKMGGSTGSYIADGGVQYSVMEDTYTHTTTTKTRIQSSSGGGGGGGRSSFSGGGFSGGGGKF